jgi:DNA-binding Lrp family transcriptional regulator
MQYPLKEKIGRPELFVGRQAELKLLNHWLANIPKEVAKSRAILARRKSGKTCLVQRIFNRLWSDQGMVIPFYFSFEENKIWYPNLALDYYRTFASQYISFVERDPRLVNQPLSLAEIRQYGVTKQHPLLVRDLDSFVHDQAHRGFDLMWKTACSAPHRFAAYFDLRWLVILDEFQYLTQYVYRDEACREALDDTLPGSYHSLSESKVAPMLVTGSYAGWLLNIISKYLEAGRLRPMKLSPYLATDAGLEAVYRYAQYFNTAITNETAVQINELCFADPFFITCVLDSDYPNKDLTTAKGVIDVVTYEITDRGSEMSKTWNEYLHLTFSQVNDRYAKSLLLFLNKHPERYWTPKELKAELHIENLTERELQKRLEAMTEADVIEQGVADIDFRGLQDGTLHLIISNRFEKEINQFVPNLPHDLEEKLARLETDNRSLRGRLNQLSGLVAEYQLAIALRSRKRFALTEFGQGVRDTTVLTITQVEQRVLLQREDGKGLELDIVAHSSCGRVVLVEVKKTQVKTGLTLITDFGEKVQVYQRRHPEEIILPLFLSLGGFTEEALQFCNAQGIGWATQIEQY